MSASVFVLEKLAQEILKMKL